MLMYGGISIDISPSGPLTCTVLIDCDLAPFPPTAFGGITLNVTLGGTESGSDPILDSHRAVVVKVLGRRNLGIDSTGVLELEMACAHRRRAGANMVWMWAIGCWPKDLGGRPRSCEVAEFSPTSLVMNSSCVMRDLDQLLPPFTRRVVDNTIN